MGGLDFTTIAVLVVAGAVAAMIAIVNFKFAMVTYVGMVMASCLAPPIDWQGNPVPTWIMPIQQRRSEIFALCGALLLVPMVFHLPRVKFGRVSVQGIFMLLIAGYAGFVRMIASDYPQAGIESIGFAALTILPAIIMLPSVLEDDEDVLRMFRLLALMSAVWAFCCAVQFVIRPIVLTLGGGYTRFQGMLANPQHAGSYLAVVGSVCLFLVMNDTKLRYRPLWIALTAANCLMLLWTGSRTSVAMFAMGAASILYTRVGSAILFLPVVAGIFVLGFNFLESNLADVLGRYGGGEDTRTIAWVRMLDQFYENPMFGTGAAEDTKSSENSILFGLATYGIGMGLLLVLYTLVSAFLMLRLYVLRFKLPGLERRMADFVIGFNAMYFAGAQFEGYLISRVSSGLAFMMFFASLASWLAMRARETPEAEEHHAADLSESALGYTEYADYGADPGVKIEADDRESR
ncbi:MAG: hypothetical protein SFZ24_12800 [Planctomycetota bacterium]|nr:hypothetical protein [Planctomycetota bacterium]